MRHLANPALNLQIEASNAAAPELAGVVVPHTASIQMHAAQNQIFGLVLARTDRPRCSSGDVRCYGASGDDIASIGGLLTERWLHRRRC